MLALTALLITGCTRLDTLHLQFPEEPVRLRVVSYNIRSALTGSGRTDLERIAGEIGHAEADLVLLQEVDRRTDRSGEIHQAERLGEMLGMEWVFAVADRTMDGGQLGNAIISRFPVLESGGVRLPGDLLRVRRAVAYAVIAGPGELRLLAVSGHLSLDRDDRIASSQWMVDRVRNVDGPFVAGVDLNAGSKSAESLTLSRAFSLSEPVPSYPAGAPRLAIDRILAAPASHVKIETTTRGAAGLSDHRMIISEITILPRIQNR